MRKTATLFLSGVTFLALAALGCNGYDQESHSATLNNANEVPPVTAGVDFGATGTFSAVVDGPVVKYTLTIGGTGLANITAAHIHAGAAGTNGGIEVFLFDTTTPFSPTANYTGKIGTNSFTADLVTACTPGCLASRSFNTIVSGMSDGTQYVNVHTSANAGGAIRGQIN